ncbi:uncharacterized protein RCO7_05692 [Rhynchosporium graminicola]|uniref:Non-homologous end-joining factor 1 n=1 Tax=Rhynchosporium graminicola TaxID=2792576 RepID=A0A1E1KBV0_9HELO|nr:uncharacterized protein RCO7_05692 [Rhynchosporium commune]
MVWSPLGLSPAAGAHLPPLLISTAFTASSFEVHLTDLTYIWSEKLNRSEILKRSKDEVTSIDPGEDGQMKIFLEKMKLGLSGEDGTALALTINHGPDRPSLVLSVSVELPGRLAALQWPVRLLAAPQTLLTCHLTMPLLQTQYALMREKTSLIDALKDKDHVIQKLMDKIEEQGIDLGQMFPQAAGKLGRKVDRKKAEEKVRGIARFDVDSWRQGLSHEQPEDTSKLIGEVFEKQTDGITVVPVTYEEQESWWDDIKGLTVHLDSGKISTKGPSKVKPKAQIPSLQKDETQQEDDAFQTQSKPPPAISPSKSAFNSSKVDASTDTDDDDLNVLSQRSKAPLTHATPKSTKKLGALGKKKAAQEPTPQPPDNQYDDHSTADGTSPLPKLKGKSATLDEASVPHIPQNKLGKIGGKKAGPLPEPEPEPEPESEPEPNEEVDGEKATSPSPPPAPSKAKKGKLGRIGGKKKAVVDEEPEPEPPASTPPESSQGSAAATPKRKLGALGHGRKMKREDGVKEEESSQRGRGGSQMEKEKTKTPEPERRETSLERADRKRDALKRELEAKAKAPVKKKRKF